MGVPVRLIVVYDKDCFVASLLAMTVTRCYIPATVIARSPAPAGRRSNPTREFQIIGPRLFREQASDEAILIE